MSPLPWTMTGTDLCLSSEWKFLDGHRHPDGTDGRGRRPTYLLGGASKISPRASAYQAGTPPPFGGHPGQSGSEPPGVQRVHLSTGCPGWRGTPITSSLPNGRYTDHARLTVTRRRHGAAGLHGLEGAGRPVEIEPQDLAAPRTGFTLVEWGGSRSDKPIQPKGGVPCLHQTVIVLDFGGQYNQLIARRVRECGVYCEVKPYTTPLADIRAMNPIGIIFTGGPNSVYDPKSPRWTRPFSAGRAHPGHLLRLPAHGPQPGRPGHCRQDDTAREYGKTETYFNTDCKLFKGLPQGITWMSHGDYMEKVPEGFSWWPTPTPAPMWPSATRAAASYGVSTTRGQPHRARHRHDPQLPL